MKRVAPEIKAAALADLATGEQPAIVADRYGLNRHTVKVWRTRMKPDLEPIGVPLVSPKRGIQQLTLAELVQENLRAKLIATQRIAEHVASSNWLDKQTAADVAELFESLDRSAIGILDRLAARHNSAAADDRDSSGVGER